MAYVTAEARQELLDAIATTTDELAAALSALGVAYELLDEVAGDRLEEELFRPVQHAYGRLQKVHGDFAGRVGLPGRTFLPVAPAGGARGAREVLDRAVTSIARADAELSTLQDSMMPVEVGDAELRAGLADVRGMLDGLQGAARRLVGVLGR